jgi:hypothetical protein
MRAVPTVDRMSPIRLLVLWLLCTSVVWSTPQPSENPTFTPLPLKRVGVVSLFGDTFHGVKIGLTAFNNAKYAASVSDWGVDEDTEAFVLSTLQEAGYTVSGLQIGPKSIDGLYVSAGLFKEAEQADLTELRRLATEQGFDTVVVVERDQHAIMPMSMPMPPGYGLLEQGLGHVWPYAQFRVEIVDVRTGKRIATRVGGPIDGFPNKAITWKAKFEDFSDDEKRVIKKAVEDLIHQELLYVLVVSKVLPPRPGIDDGPRPLPGGTLPWAK